jgi:transposase
MDLTEKQWEVIAPRIPEPPRRADGRGRPWSDSRTVLNGVLWVLRTGAQWKDLPPRYGSKSTVHRRFQQWVGEGVFEEILAVLAGDLKERGALDLSECFIDGTFVSAKKGGQVWDPRNEAKAAKSWQWQTALVFLSPSTLALLHRRRSPLLTLYSPSGLQWILPSA